MSDREKVIKGLEYCKWSRQNVKPEKNKCDECPYKDKSIMNAFSVWRSCTNVLAGDALSMLKEQEAKQAIKQIYHVMMNRDYENPVEVTRYDWLCPTCKSLLCRDIDVIDDNYHFCKVCGQAVKWK